MRNFHVMSVVVIGLGAAILSLPAVYAQDRNDQSAPSQNHVQQHQQTTPAPNSATRGGQPDQHDQSAEAPNAPGVIAPPATGDKSVITPPATGAAKMPVIPPPGTPGGNSEVEPK